MAEPVKIMARVILVDISWTDISNRREQRSWYLWSYISVGSSRANIYVLIFYSRVAKLLYPFWKLVLSNWSVIYDLIPVGSTWADNYDPIYWSVTSELSFTIPLPDGNKVLLISNSRYQSRFEVYRNTKTKGGTILTKTCIFDIVLTGKVFYLYDSGNLTPPFLAYIIYIYIYVCGLCRRAAVRAQCFMPPPDKS